MTDYTRNEFINRTILENDDLSDDDKVRILKSLMLGEESSPSKKDAAMQVEREECNNKLMRIIREDGSRAFPTPQVLSPPLLFQDSLFFSPDVFSSSGMIEKEAIFEFESDKHIFFSKDSALNSFLSKDEEKNVMEFKVPYLMCVLIGKDGKLIEDEVTIDFIKRSDVHFMEKEVERAGFEIKEKGEIQEEFKKERHIGSLVVPAQALLFYTFPTGGKLTDFALRPGDKMIFRCKAKISPRWSRMVWGDVICAQDQARYPGPSDTLLPPTSDTLLPPTMQDEDGLNTLFESLSTDEKREIMNLYIQQEE